MSYQGAYLTAFVVAATLPSTATVFAQPVAPTVAPGTPAVKTAQAQLTAWMDCLFNHARPEAATTQESADVIADHALAGCMGDEKQSRDLVVKALAQQHDTTPPDTVMADLKAIARKKLTDLIGPVPQPPLGPAKP